jgi:hypothetical protein
MSIRLITGTTAGSRPVVVVPHACHKPGSITVTRVTPNYGWPQVSPKTSASFEGSQALKAGSIPVTRPIAKDSYRILLVSIGTLPSFSCIPLAALSINESRSLRLAWSSRNIKQRDMLLDRAARSPIYVLGQGQQ